MQQRLRFGSGVAVATIVFVALAGGTAHASDPGAFFDPNSEGSVTDTQNTLGAASSDLSATNAAFAAGCTHSATTPAKRPNPSSSTGQDIFTRVTVACTGGSTGSDQFDLQRHRWYGWQTLASTSVSNASVFHADLATNCRAGTWSYRVLANDFHTSSYRTTCNNLNDLFYIDLS